MADIPMDIKSWRRAYLNKSEPFLLEEKLPSKNPFTLFDIWFKDVASQTDLSFEEVNAVNVSTVGRDMRPSSRMVLLKAYDNAGFTFYSNRTSRKGLQLQENPKAAMLFFWPSVHRQIRIEGTVVELPPQDAVDYWNSRPLSSRIGSKTSLQSELVPDRQHLMERKQQLEDAVVNAGEAAITKPDSWIGYQVLPEYFEFWQGQSDRLHDRIVFDRNDVRGTDVGAGWHMYRLAP